MRRQFQHLLLVVALLPLLGCNERERVSSDYVLVTPESLNPDSHPGTALHRKGKVVWGNVYVGYFSGYSPKQFYHDGMFVFVGAVPGNTDWWYHSQLFAVRGSGPPVLLSERVLGEPFVISYDSRQYHSRFAVHEISPITNGVRVQFTHAPSTIHHDTNSVDLPWTLIRRFLDEADASSRRVEHEFGNYRVLPLK